VDTAGRATILIDMNWYSPLHLAHSVATLDQLSGGGVELGVAGGGPRRPPSATAWWCGANIAPTQDITTSKRSSG
jgi:hypothetical protein